MSRKIQTYDIAEMEVIGATVTELIVLVQRWRNGLNADDTTNVVAHSVSPLFDVEYRYIQRKVDSWLRKQNKVKQAPNNFVHSGYGKNSGKRHSTAIGRHAPWLIVDDVPVYIDERDAYECPDFVAQPFTPYAAQTHDENISRKENNATDLLRAERHRKLLNRILSCGSLAFEPSGPVVGRLDRTFRFHGSIERESETGNTKPNVNGEAFSSVIRIDPVALTWGGHEEPTWRGLPLTSGPPWSEG